MQPAQNTESAVRRLFSEDDGSLSAASKDVASTVKRVQYASTEMRQLRTKVAEQHKAFWDQKDELADARRQLAEAISATLKSDKALQIERARAELAEARSEKLERDIVVLREHLDGLTDAIDQAFPLVKVDIDAGAHRSMPVCASISRSSAA